MAGQVYGPVVLLGWLVKVMVQLFCWGGWSSLWSSWGFFVVVFFLVAGQAYGPIVLLGVAGQAYGPVVLLLCEAALL